MPQIIDLTALEPVESTGGVVDVSALEPVKHPVLDATPEEVSKLPDFDERDYFADNEADLDEKQQAKLIEAYRLRTLDAEAHPLRTAGEVAVKTGKGALELLKEIPRMAFTAANTAATVATAGDPEANLVTTLANPGKAIWKGLSTLAKANSSPMPALKPGEKPPTGLVETVLAGDEFKENRQNLQKSFGELTAASNLAAGQMGTMAIQAAPAVRSLADKIPLPPTKAASAIVGGISPELDALTKPASKLTPEEWQMRFTAGAELKKRLKEAGKGEGDLSKLLGLDTEALRKEGVELDPQAIQDLSVFTDPVTLSGFGAGFKATSAGGRSLLTAKTSALAERAVEKIRGSLADVLAKQGADMVNRGARLSKVGSGGAGAVISTMATGSPVSGAVAGLLVPPTLKLGGWVVADKLAPLVRTPGTVEGVVGGPIKAGIKGGVHALNPLENPMAALPVGAALGSDNPDESAMALAGPLAFGVFGGVAGEAAKRGAKGARAGADSLRKGRFQPWTPPETRSRPYGVDPTQDAAHATNVEALRQTNPEAANRIEYFRDNVAGRDTHVHLLTDEEMVQSLGLPIGSDAPSGAFIEGQKGSPTRILLNADATALGHEGGHLVTALAGAEWTQRYHQSILQSFSPEQILQFGKQYDSALKRSGVPANKLMNGNPDRIVAELGAELLSRAVNSEAISGAPKGLLNTVFEAAALWAEQAGIATPPSVAPHQTPGFTPLGASPEMQATSMGADEVRRQVEARKNAKPPVIPPATSPAAATPQAPQTPAQTPQALSTPAPAAPTTPTSPTPPASSNATSATTTSPSAGSSSTAVGSTAPAAAPPTITPSVSPAPTPSVSPAPTPPLKNLRLTPEQQQSVESRKQVSGAGEAEAAIARGGYTPEATESFAKVNESLQREQGDVSPVSIEYDSVKADQGGQDEATIRKQEQDAVYEQERAAAYGTIPADLRQQVEKTTIPNRWITRGDNVNLLAMSTDKVIANAYKVAKTAGDANADLVPYPTKAGIFTDAGWRGFVKDFTDYSRNQANGFAGDGSKVVRPADYSGNLPPENPSYKPVTMDKSKADFLNLVMALPPPKTSRGGATAQVVPNIEAAKLAKANQRPVVEPARTAEPGKSLYVRKEGSFPIAETNPLRDDFARRGIDFTGRELFQVTEELDLQRIRNVQPKPENPLRAPNTDLVRAGFMPDPTAGAKRETNPKVRDVESDYLRSVGMGRSSYDRYEPVNQPLARRFADAYEAAKDSPDSPEVQKAYAALADETRAQWDAIEAAGYRMEPWTKEGQPYANSADMVRDVSENKHLWFFPTENGFGTGETNSTHPLFAESGVNSGGKPLLVNDLFRAVHDFFGHAKEGYQFGPRGEYNAFLAHSRMFSDEAVKALASETMAQNSWVNFGKHTEGKTLRPEEKPYADQKAVLLDPELVQEALAPAGEAKFMPNPEKLADDRTSGKAFKGFFSDVTKGAGKYVPKAPWNSLVDLSKESDFLREYDKHTGNFDNHIATSIPAYKDVQVRTGSALAKVLPKGSKVLDIAGSEGSWAKTISALRNGDVETVVLDPNPDMAEFYRTKSSAPGSRYSEEAFLQGFEDGGKVVPAFNPEDRFDAIHEGMGFQFISPDRPAQIAEAKRLLKPDGIFFSEEKLLTPPDQWKANETKKDREFKNQYYDDAALAAKQAVVKFQQDPNEAKSVGMVDNMVSDSAFEAELGKNFKHVVQYWDSGNFKGYVASDSPEALKRFVDSVGDTNTDFSTVRTPREAKFMPRTEAGKKLVEDGYHFDDSDSGSGTYFLKIRKPYADPEIAALNKGFENKTSPTIASISAAVTGPGKAKVGLVSVDKEFQGKGLSEVLYRELGSRLQRDGITELSGDVINAGPVLHQREKVFGAPLKVEFEDRNLGLGELAPTARVTSEVSQKSRFMPKFEYPKEEDPASVDYSKYSAAKKPQTPDRRAPTGWINPLGEYVSAPIDRSGSYANTGDWHNETIQKLSPEEKKKFGLSKNADRIEALQKGFVRVRFTGQTGDLSIEAPASAWKRNSPQVAEARKVAAEHAGKTSTLRLTLFDEDGNVSDNRSEQLFKLGSSEREAAADSLLSPTRRREMQFMPAPERNTPESKGWFRESKVVDESGEPQVVHHGTARGDRVGNRFRKTRATSGPMAFFTDARAVAESYSKSKPDTSFEQPSDYREWFKIGRKNLRDAWWYLTPEQRQLATERLKTVGFEDADKDEGPIVSNSRSVKADDGVAWDLKEAKGNALEAAKEIWLSSGTLFNREAEFLDVLKGLGIEDAKLVDPNATSPKVYDVLLSIQNPLDTQNIPAEVVAALEKKSRRARQASGFGVDSWDKNNQDPKEWIDRLKQGISNKENSYVWTSIPDWVSSTLEDLGYDGIKDAGNKSGNAGDHTVWIPFDDRQVKSAFENKGSYDPANPDIRFMARATKDTGTPDLFGGRVEQDSVKTRIKHLGQKYPEAILPEYRKDPDTGDFVLDAKGKPKPVARDYDLRESPLARTAGKGVRKESERLKVETKAFADAAEPELKAALDNPEIAAGADWYSKFREKIQTLIPDDADRTLFAHLLGATSARTPVGDNYKQAVEAFNKYKSGDYQRHIDGYLEGQDLWESGKLQKKFTKATGKEPNSKTAVLDWWIEKNDIKPLKDNEKGYNANSRAVLRALAGTWLAETQGPKTPNFAGNLAGTTFEATIDVWAARFLHRLGNRDNPKRWRILPQNETGVHDADFYFGQQVFRELSRRTGIKPDSLQAVLWFAEKDHWSKKGWTRGEGAEKSDFNSLVDKTKRTDEGRLDTTEPTPQLDMFGSLEKKE